ncbi:MAG: hypothetical protein IJS53_01165 [Clostridia bacterium]|nr:hypothetical protein [Clostridia bacterium]
MKNNTLTKIVSIVVLVALLCATLVGAYLGIFGRNTQYVNIVEDGQETSRALYRQVAFIPNTINENWQEAIRPSAALAGGYSYTLTADGADAAALNKIAKVAAARARLITGSASAKVADGAVVLTVPEDSYYSLISSCLQTTGTVTLCVYDSENGILEDPILTAEHIKQAYYVNNSSAYQVKLELNGKGAKIYNDLYANNAYGVLYLLLDGSAVGYTYITKLDNNVVTFTASDWSSAFIAVDNIRSGEMPTAVTLASVGEAEASMGGFLNIVIIVCAVALLAACALLVVRCRLNGVIAIWTLLVYLVLFFLSVALIAVSVSWTMDLLSVIVLVCCVALFAYGWLRLFLCAGAEKGLRGSLAVLDSAARKQFKTIALGCCCLVAVGLLLMFIFQSGMYGVLGRFVALSGVISFVALLVFPRVVAACGKAALSRK